MVIPDFILIQETIDKYQYDPVQFKGKKDYYKFIVRTCFTCWNVYDQKFINAIDSFRKNKKCKFCANRERSMNNAANMSKMMKEKYESGKINPPMLNKSHTEESKSKIRKHRMGKSFEEIFGKERSEEIKSKISKSISGERNPFFGQKHTPEVIEFLRKNSSENTKRGQESNLFGKNYNKMASTEEFIEKCISIHGDRYDYSKTVYNGRKSYIEIICKQHGIFHQMAYIHIDGCGCPKCNLSKGELKILSFLLANGIRHNQQFKFEDCRRINPLPFDFYLPDKHICIEYDGELHYKEVGFNNLDITKENDEIKNDFCLKNGIRLVRISYIEKDNIEEILIKEIMI